MPHAVSRLRTARLARASKPFLARGGPACHGNGSTIGFRMESPEHMDAWHAAGVANGGTTCEDPPGPRDGSVGQLYLAYLRDPDGNKFTRCTGPLDRKTPHAAPAAK